MKKQINTKVISQAKRETYLANLKNGSINNKTMRILYFIKQKPFVNTDEIRSILEISHQSATAIISLLLDIGLIKIVGESKLNDNTYSKYLFVSDYQEQYNLSVLRHEEKYTIWLNQGIHKFKDLIPSDLYEVLLNNKIEKND